MMLESTPPEDRTHRHVRAQPVLRPRQHELLELVDKLARIAVRFFVAAIGEVHLPVGALASTGCGSRRCAE